MKAAQLSSKPGLVIALLVAAFFVILGIALYSPAFVASTSIRGSSSTFSVTAISYVHSNNNALNVTASNTIPPANYTGVFYVQHVCTYRQ